MEYNPGIFFFLIIKMLRGTIYCIRCEEFPDDCYIGSTTKTATRRFQGHKGTARKNPQPFHRILNERENAWDCTRIEILEEIEVPTKRDLLKREQHYIDTLAPTWNKTKPYLEGDDARARKAAAYREKYWSDPEFRKRRNAYRVERLRITGQMHKLHHARRADF